MISNWPLKNAEFFLWSLNLICWVFDIFDHAKKKMQMDRMLWIMNLIFVFMHYPLFSQIYVYKPVFSENYKQGAEISNKERWKFCHIFLFARFLSVELRSWHIWFLLAYVRSLEANHAQTPKYFKPYLVWKWIKLF